jgi:hypothetical protein
MFVFAFAFAHEHVPLRKNTSTYAFDCGVACGGLCLEYVCLYFFVVVSLCCWLLAAAGCSPRWWWCVACCCFKFSYDQSHLILRFESDQFHIRHQQQQQQQLPNT